MADGRVGWVAVTGALAAGAVATTAALGVADVAGLAVGIGAAWVVQAVSLWPLAGALARGADATRVWAVGIAARISALGALWLGAPAIGVDSRPVAIGYAAGLAALLVLEAGWLSRRPAGAAPGAPSRRPRGRTAPEGVAGQGGTTPDAQAT